MGPESGLVGGAYCLSFGELGNVGVCRMQEYMLEE